MHLYYISPNIPYYQALAQFTLEYFAKNMRNLKIILPSGADCRYFQECLIEASPTNNIILPSVVPSNSILAEGDLHYQLPSAALMNYNRYRFHQIGAMARILTNVLNNLSLHTAMSLAADMLNTIEELKLNEILPQQLLELECFNESQHHINSLTTLYDIYNIWQKEYKHDSAYILQTLLDNEISSLSKNPKQILLIAGTAGKNVIAQRFIQRVLSHDNGYCVLPPLTLNTAHYNAELSSVLDLLQCDAQQIKELPTTIPPNTNNEFQEFLQLEFHKQKEQPNNIELLTFDNIAEEISYAIKLAQSYQSFAIIAPNENIAEECTVFLQKCGAEYQNHVPHKLSLSNQFTIFALIANDLAIPGFNSKSFLEICKHPYIHSRELEQLEYILRKKKHGITTEYVVSQASELGLVNIVNYLERKSFLETRNFSFSKFILEYINIVNSFTDKVYCGNAGKKLVEILQDIQNLSLDVRLKPEQYRDLFLLLTKHITYTDFSDNISKARVHLLLLENSALYNYDACFVLECNQDILPPKFNHDPWLGDKLRQTLKLSCHNSYTEQYNYLFYLMLHKKQIYLGRSKQDMGEVLLESRLIGHLKSLWNISEQYITENIDSPIESTVIDMPSITVYLPDKISATSIERLIKDPYQFWLQNILNIRSIDSLDNPDKLKDYGIFVHKVIELYTNQGQGCRDVDNQDRWQEISEQLMYEMNLCEITAALWRPKIAKTYLLFAHFEKTRTNILHVYTEIHGKRVVNLEHHDITITSIADRIEVDTEGNITIVDFKTGSIPTKDEVLRGYAVQMLIEAIIMADSGFAELRWNGEKLTCLYVRLGSQLDMPEYLEITLTREEINRHLDGLKKLLSDYDQSSLSNYQMHQSN